MYIAPTKSQMNCIVREMLIRNEQYKRISEYIGTQDSIILDVGGNIGYYAMGLLKYCRHSEVYVIEPCKRNVAYAAKNLENQSSAIIVNLGLGS